MDKPYAVQKTGNYCLILQRVRSTEWVVKCEYAGRHPGGLQIASILVFDGQLTLQISWKVYYKYYLGILGLGYPIGF